MLKNGARIFHHLKSSDVTYNVRDLFTRHDAPATVITENGATFTAQHRNGHNPLETKLHQPGVIHKHLRP
jgi:hypothetical protein